MLSLGNVFGDDDLREFDQRVRRGLGRGPDDPPLKSLQDKLDAAKNSVKRERDRTEAIDKAIKALANPTDAPSTVHAGVGPTSGVT